MLPVNESFWAVTGTLRNNQFPKDLQLAARPSATVIILMGAKKLAEIVALFKKYRSNMEPIAIIQNGSLKNETSVISYLGNIVKLSEENHIGSPAIIVIGKVVGEKPLTLKKFIKQAVSVGREVLS